MFIINTFLILFIISGFLDRGTRTDGNIRNDIPSTIGFSLSMFLILLIILKVFNIIKLNINI